jgi:hypothetical protein
MRSTRSTFASLLDRCRKGVASIVQSFPDCVERADRLADLLGQLSPHAACTVCLLHEGGTSRYAFRSPTGANDSDKKTLIQSRLASFCSSMDGVEALTGEAVPEHLVLVAAIRFDDKPRGFLAIAFSGFVAEEERKEAEALLSVAASTAGLSGTLLALRRSAEEQKDFTLLGLAFLGATHEINNALNNMMLQTSVVQLQTGDRASAELAAIRQHGARAAGLLRSIHHAANKRQEEFYLVDLNAVIVELLEENPGLYERVQSRSPLQGVFVRGTHALVRHLIALVLEGVNAASKDVVEASLHRNEEGVALTLTFTVFDKNDDECEALSFDSIVWSKLDEIGVYAGKSLLRQLGCTATAEGFDSNKVLVRMIWNTVAEPLSSS